MKQWKVVGVECAIIGIAMLFTQYTSGMNDTGSKIDVIGELDCTDEYDLRKEGDIGEACAVEQGTYVGSKSYYMASEGEIVSDIIPCLILFENSKFGFTYDILSSYYAYGTYTIEDGLLILRTDDGKYYYSFAVNDVGEYIFLAEQSSEMLMISKIFGVQIKDGAVFRLAEE